MYYSFKGSWNYNTFLYLNKLKWWKKLKLGIVLSRAWMSVHSVLGTNPCYQIIIQAYEITSNLLPADEFAMVTTQFGLILYKAKTKIL